jgi:cation diffusion facilitator family transporter
MNQPINNTEKHSHSHSSVDVSALTSKRGIWAVKWSFVILAITALFQLIISLTSGSIALLADTIHNIADAATAIPLWIAFSLTNLKPSNRFTYGYGRVEDLAGVVIILIILASAVFAGYESILRLFHPQEMSHVNAVIIAAIVGFLGNEFVAIFRIKVGKEIGSAALVADGYHAQIDGFTSLAVLFSAIGAKLGFPLVDPIVGLIITLIILKIVLESIKMVFTRLLDGIEPEIINEIKHTASHIKQVNNVTEVRARWIGHYIHAELNIAVNPKLSVEEGHNIAKEVRHQLLHNLKYLSNAIIHVDPIHESGEIHHRVINHKHDNLSIHSHD